jgi:hypothetical protein
MLLLGGVVALAPLPQPGERTPDPRVVSARMTTATTATTVGGSSTDYSFLARNLDGSPARWNPCAPIHWRVNATNAPVNGGQHIEETLRRITAATGITFVRDGRTTILPDGRSFSGWGTTRLIIGYATATQRPRLAGSVVGDGGAQLQWVNNRWQIARGYALLDRIDLAKKPAGFGTGNTQGSVYMHELGHAMGLGHARALPQVMYGSGSASSMATWQRGDLAGLVKLGRRAGCLPQPV